MNIMKTNLAQIGSAKEWLLNIAGSREANREENQKDDENKGKRSHGDTKNGKK